MKKLFLFTALAFLTLGVTAQSTEQPLSQEGSPLYFVDSIKVTPGGIQSPNAPEVASIYVVDTKEAILLMGDAGKNGIIYIETKPFARKRFERYFKSKSPDYTKAIKNLAGDTAAVQYILNEKVLTKHYEGELATITDKTFKELVIVSKEELKTKYGITDKQFGVAIKTSAPDVSNAKPSSQ